MDGRPIRHYWEPGAAILRPMESVMAKSKDRDVSPFSEQPHRALLLGTQRWEGCGGWKRSDGLDRDVCGAQLGFTTENTPHFYSVDHERLM